MERDLIKRLPVKLFEVRDRATFLPVIAVRLVVPVISGYVRGIVEDTPRDTERWLLRRAGYAREQIENPTDTPYILLVKLDGAQAQYDPYSWHGVGRTMGAAHQYIIDYWNKLKSGDVIGVEFIAGESAAPKQSERVTHG